jgi:hypothetical protein
MPQPTNSGHGHHTRGRVHFPHGHGHAVLAHLNLALTAAAAAAATQGAAAAPVLRAALAALQLRGSAQRAPAGLLRALGARSLLRRRPALDLNTAERLASEALLDAITVAADLEPHRGRRSQLVRVRGKLLEALYGVSL